MLPVMLVCVCVCTCAVCIPAQEHKTRVFCLQCIQLHWWMSSSEISLWHMCCVYAQECETRAFCLQGTQLCWCVSSIKISLWCRCHAQECQTWAATEEPGRAGTSSAFHSWPTAGTASHHHCYPDPAGSHPHAAGAGIPGRQVRWCFHHIHTDPAGQSSLLSGAWILGDAQNWLILPVLHRLLVWPLTTTCLDLWLMVQKTDYFTYFTQIGVWKRKKSQGYCQFLPYWHSNFMMI